MKIIKITHVIPESGYKLHVAFDNGNAGLFDVTPYLECNAFMPLKQHAEFKRIRNGGYFVEWDCGADLSADTLAAHIIKTN